MSRNSPRKVGIDLDKLPQHPNSPGKNYYGSTEDGIEDRPETYRACNLDMFAVTPATWFSRAPKSALLSDNMVGKFLEMGFAPADCARWYPGDFVCDKTGVISIRPGRKNSGHPSLAETGEIRVAYEKILSGHPIHGCKVEDLGIQVLTLFNRSHPDEVTMINSIIECYYILNSRIENKRARSVGIPQNAQVIAGASNAEDREVSPPRKKLKTKGDGNGGEGEIGGDWKVDGGDRKKKPSN